MASTSSKILRVVRQRPLTSVGLTATVSGLSYASWVEYQATRQERSYWKSLELEGDNKPTLSAPPLLPRVYSWDALHEYWSIRPMTTLGRLLEIGGSLSPLMVRSLWDFKVSPLLLEDNTENANSDDKKELMRQHAAEWRHVLTRLGPAFVKAGQQLSIRPDLVPPVVLEELQKLCDSVQPVPDEIAMAVLEQELGQKPDDLFDNLRLVASASLGQVYKGTLKNSNNKEEVAVKIQRPGMVQAFSLDLFLLQCWGIFMDSWTSVVTHQKPYHKDFLQNFAKGGYGELDYELEANNQKHFQHEMDIRGCQVVIPDVHDDYTTRRVLTTQWIDGIRLSDAPPETIRRLIPIGVELFLCQLLDIGAFHGE